MRDFDQDGDLDLAVANFGTNNVKILLGTGNGGLTSAGFVPVGTHPFLMVAGDVDGDGKLDLAVASEGTNSVTVLLGNGSAGFTPGGSISVGTDRMP